jgi:ribosomal protein S18 acetylase RimI-like enzyme
VAISIDGPLTAPGDLDQLAPLWRQLHAHHLGVASYRPLVEDPDLSWSLRRAWYERLLAEGAVYLVAREDGAAVGYAVVQVEPGQDDTFDVGGGVGEVVSLVVADRLRGQGIGRMLWAAAEAHARRSGAGAMKVAVMAGNDQALAFYRAEAMELGELVLYRRLP